MNKLLLLSGGLATISFLCFRTDNKDLADSTKATTLSRLETAKAKKLKMDSATNAFHLPKPVVQIDVAKKYGIKADGTTDNLYELLRLNQDCEGADKPFYSFVFPPGEVLYSDNTWLQGIDSFEVIGKGTSFRCIANSPWDVAKQFLYNGGMLSLNPRRLGHEGHPEGHRFKTIAAGSKTISLANKQDVDNYKAGDRIYIAGYEEQMWGWPPNPRFFEWNSIQSVNRKEGSITIELPLRFRYNEDWKDAGGMFNDGQFFGKPRIYKINGYCRYARFAGGRFVKNKNLTKEQTPSFIFISETLVCDDLFIDGYAWPSENRYARYTNCKFISAEPDKNCGVVEFIDCKFDGGLFAATGVDSLRLIRNTFGNYSPLSPRVLYAEGNKFKTKSRGVSSLYGFFEFTHTDKVYLKNNTFSSENAEDFVHVNYSDENDFVVKDVAGSSLLLEDDNNPQSAFARPMKNIGFGSLIKSKDGKASGIVKDIVHDEKNWIIQLENIKGKPLKGQTWTYRQTDKVYDLGGNKAIDGKKLWK